ncbi:bactofilin family protein [Fulvivirga sedimenti]|uniref:Polymer-forming cytoskeletal protein n=1 Tax=Fulvivirga sedimenti TaxID=2879465 RepID=A0A9X1HLL1_9BACT|nr:polymer-forming cytoskeletal protein [Fulvivirga sedimenti]MCA6074250.1 polymer-forming cytoskeletal protein [Fulvivirga sedimenti]
MFKNQKEEKVSPEVLNSNNTIGKGTTFTGNIETYGNIRIEGKIVGDLHSKSKIVIGPSAEIQGNVTGQFVEVEGNVRGTLKATEQITLKGTCKILGDIETSKLVVESGAEFNGKCKMGKVASMVASSPEKTEHKPSLASNG